MANPRYYPFLAGLTLSRETYNTTLMSWILYVAVHNISNTTKSDIGWPTLLMIFIL
jgi:hypothetical protein